MLGDVDGLVQDHPSDCLVAGRGCGGAVVGHVVVRVRQQASDGEPLHEGLVASVPDPLQLIGEHAQLRVGKVSQLER